MCVICTLALNLLLRDNIIDEQIHKYYGQKAIDELMAQAKAQAKDPEEFKQMLAAIERNMHHSHGKLKDKEQPELIIFIAAEKLEPAPKSLFTEEMLQKLQQDIKQGKVH